MFWFSTINIQLRYVVVKVYSSWAEFRQYLRQQEGEKQLLAFTKRGSAMHSVCCPSFFISLWCLTFILVIIGLYNISNDNLLTPVNSKKRDEKVNPLLFSISIKLLIF